MKVKRWKILPPALPSEEPRRKFADQENEAVVFVQEGVDGAVDGEQSAAFFLLGATWKDGGSALERRLPLIKGKSPLGIEANICTFVRFVLRRAIKSAPSLQPNTSMETRQRFSFVPYCRSFVRANVMIYSPFVR